MWACQACMRQRFQTLVGDATLLSPFPNIRRPIITNPGSPTYRRNYAAASKQGTKPIKRTSNLPSQKSTNASLSRWKKRQEWLDSRGVRPVHKPIKKDVDQDFALRKQLQYLKDPLKLAEHVRRCLRDGDVDGTLAIVRFASKSVQCTVSWNHLIEWHLTQGKLRAALRIYNEMKKRAQVPDARTYTIIFNGAASHPSATESLGRVLSIYQSMLTDRCLVKPNTIHVNAILKMCARAQNMDAMFAIADQLPQKGLRAPNNLTYTTIINAIRIYAVNDLRSTLTREQKEANRQKAMLDARQLWQDLTARWWQGDLWIDEELVCAMGRILLLGGEQDRDDILSLIEQSMNIPRQAPRLRISAPKLVETKSQEYSLADGDGVQESEPSQKRLDTQNDGHFIVTGRNQMKEAASTEKESEAQDNGLDDALLNQFQSTALINSPRTPASAYAKPGSNTLSLLMQSLLHPRLKEPASKYWDLLTKEYGVKPDADNYHAYLRVLRAARASGDTVKLLTEMPRPYLMNKTFRIAMSTCQRDKNNHNVFANSGRILDLMQQTQEVPDIPSLQMYLDLAMVAPFSSKKVPKDRLEAKLPQGEQIMRALSRLGPSLINIRSILVLGDKSRTGKEPREAILKDVVALTRKMISAHDILINNGMTPTSVHGKLAAQRSKLSAFVTRFKHGKSRLLNQPTLAKEDDGNDEQLFILDDYSEPDDIRRKQQASHT